MLPSALECISMSRTAKLNGREEPKAFVAPKLRISPEEMEEA